VGSGLLYALGRHLFPAPTTRIYLLLCAGFTPWLFAVSRISFELIALFPILAFFLCATYRAFEWESQRWAVAAGCAIGLSVYAYSTFRLLAPLHVIAVLLCYAPKRQGRLLALFVAGAVIASLPFVGYALGHFGNLTERFAGLTYLSSNELSVTDKLWTFLDRYFGYLSPGFLAFDGDANRRHHTGFGGELLLPTAVLLIVGVLWTLVSGELRRRPFVRLLVIGLFLAPVAAALTGDRQHSLRAFSMVPFALLLSAYGIGRLEKWRIAEVMVLLTAVNAAVYADDYFRRYPPTSAVAFENYGFRQAMLQAREMARRNVVVADEGNQPYIDTLFFDSVLPNPRGVRAVLADGKELQPGDVLIRPAQPGEPTNLETTAPGSRYSVRPYDLHRR
jgi:hypothetical protein